MLGRKKYIYDWIDESGNAVVALHAWSHLCFYIIIIISFIINYCTYTYFRPFKCELCNEFFEQKQQILSHYNSVAHLHKAKATLEEQSSNFQPSAQVILFFLIFLMRRLFISNCLVEFIRSVIWFIALKFFNYIIFKDHLVFFIFFSSLWYLKKFEGHFY